jgi:hypothetical protein
MWKHYNGFKVSEKDSWNKEYGYSKSEILFVGFTTNPPDKGGESLGLQSR